MSERSHASADERDRIRDEIEPDRSQGFISDAAVMAIANHKASSEIDERAFETKRTCLSSKWDRDSATDKSAGTERDHQSERIKRSD
jgi:hypothetical protein